MGQAGIKSVEANVNYTRLSGDTEARGFLMARWPQAKDAPREPKKCGGLSVVHGMMTDAVLKCSAEDGHAGDHRYAVDRQGERE
jgi:hypothetical protein